MTDELPAPILLEGVTYRVGETALVSDLTLEVKAAQTLVLLGRSGSGKTTALRLINGLIRPTEGRVLVEGKSTEEWDPIRLRRKIGYVIQEVGLFPHFTVSQNVGLVPTLEGWSESDVRASHQRAAHQGRTGRRADGASGTRTSFQGDSGNALAWRAL